MPGLLHLFRHKRRERLLGLQRGAVAVAVVVRVDFHLLGGRVVVAVVVHD